jgi:hypothetical protein
VNAEKAISIANKEVERIKSQPALEVVAAKRLSNPWNDLVPKYSGDENARKLYSKLKHRTYWMISYRPRSAELGGDVIVFVDASTGEVIHVYRGR